MTNTQNFACGAIRFWALIFLTKKWNNRKLNDNIQKDSESQDATKYHEFMGNCLDTWCSQLLPLNHTEFIKIASLIRTSCFSDRSDRTEGMIFYCTQPITLDLHVHVDLERLRATLAFMTFNCPSIAFQVFIFSLVNKIRSQNKYKRITDVR